MSLRQVIAAGFKHHGRPQLSETELVAALALDRGWFSPDEVRELIEHALEVGDLEGAVDALEPTFDVGSTTVPSGFEPSADFLRPIPPFERLVDRLEAAGHDKREVVASINRLQSDALVSNDAAALLFARRAGLDVGSEAAQLLRAIESRQA